MNILIFNLQQIFKYSIIHSFAKNIPYSLCDQSGQTVCSAMTLNDQADLFCHSIEYNGNPFLTLKGSNKIKEASNPYQKLEQIILQDVKLYDKMFSLLAMKEWEQSSFQDLINILSMFQLEKFPYQKILETALSILRGYIPVETCSIFQAIENKIEDDTDKNNDDNEIIFEKKLHGIAGIHRGSAVVFKKNSDWEINEFSIIGITAINQQHYISHNVDLDSNYKKVGEYETPTNLACFPIIHDKFLIGILNLKNNLKGFYDENDIKLINRFNIILSHIIYSKNQEEALQSFKSVNSKLGKYISHNVLEDIEKSGEAQKRGEGIKKNAVCLFCDIRSFTSISEKLSAPELVSLLNVYFAELIPIVEKYEGTVDKLVGDMIAAFWNLPQDILDPELKAVKAAIEMQKTMITKVVPVWTRAGVSRIGIGIGLHCGQVIAGNLGASQLMNYTVMGHTVHNAELLESKARPGEIWISEDIHKLTEGKILKHVRVETGIQFNGIKKTTSAYVLKPIEYPDY